MKPRKVMTYSFEKRFEPTGVTFGAFNAAATWLTSFGYSVGTMCNALPIGVLRGDFAIAKWRNLSAAERANLDGVIRSVDWREGAVVVSLKAEAEVPR